jgi:hypothetical protein
MEQGQNKKNFGLIIKYWLERKTGAAFYWAALVEEGSVADPSFLILSFQKFKLHNSC